MSRALRGPRLAAELAAAPSRSAAAGFPAGCPAADRPRRWRPRASAARTRARASSASLPATAWWRIASGGRGARRRAPRRRGARPGAARPSARATRGASASERRGPAAPAAEALLERRRRRPAAASRASSRPARRVLRLVVGGRRGRDRARRPPENPRARQARCALGAAGAGKRGRRAARTDRREQRARAASSSGSSGSARRAPRATSGARCRPRRRAGPRAGSARRGARSRRDGRRANASASRTRSTRICTPSGLDRRGNPDGAPRRTRRQLPHGRVGVVAGAEQPRREPPRLALERAPPSAPVSRSAPGNCSGRSGQTLEDLAGATRHASPNRSGDDRSRSLRKRPSASPSHGHDRDALGLAPGDREEGRAHALVEREVRGLEASLAAASRRRRARESLARVAGRRASVRSGREAVADARVDRRDPAARRGRGRPPGRPRSSRRSGRRGGRRRAARAGRIDLAHVLAAGRFDQEPLRDRVERRRARRPGGCSRIVSAIGVPPGSRVVATARPGSRRRSASKRELRRLPAALDALERDERHGPEDSPERRIFGAGMPLTW